MRAITINVGLTKTIIGKKFRNNEVRKLNNDD